MLITPRQTFAQPVTAEGKKHKYRLIKINFQKKNLKTFAQPRSVEGKNHKNLLIKIIFQKNKT